MSLGPSGEGPRGQMSAHDPCDCAPVRPHALSLLRSRASLSARACVRARTYAHAHPPNVGVRMRTSLLSSTLTGIAYPSWVFLVLALVVYRSARLSRVLALFPWFFPSFCWGWARFLNKLCEREGGNFVVIFRKFLFLSSSWIYIVCIYIYILVRLWRRDDCSGVAVLWREYFSLVYNGSFLEFSRYISRVRRSKLFPCAALKRFGTWDHRNALSQEG